MLTRTLGDIYGRTAGGAPAVSTARGMAALYDPSAPSTVTDRALAAASGIGAPIAPGMMQLAGSSRLGTMSPAQQAAYATAAKLGLQLPPPTPPQQGMPSAGANANAVNTANPSAAAIYGAQGANINTGAANPGAAPPTQQPNTGDPNAQQLSPQAQAAIAETMRRKQISDAQRMAEDRGVFSGGQQASAVPGMAMALPSLFSGGGITPYRRG